MKRMVFSLVFFLPVICFGQNVGIGVPNPSKNFMQAVV
jgi:hypothetical protein